jgi:phosphatidylserine decarboxylase
VNPIALKRVERLFCKNERAVIRTTTLPDGQAMTLVAVAAILVAGIRLRFLDMKLDRRDTGRRTFPCNVALGKGQEMGWFEHGSTIVVFASQGFRLCGGIEQGQTIRMGAPLMTTVHCADRTHAAAHRQESSPQSP